MDIMIDCETLGVQPGSVILSIAAVAFDPATGRLGVEQQWLLDAEAQPAMTVDVSTVKWWMGQSREAQAAAFGGRQSLSYALQQLAALCDHVRLTNVGGNLHVWSHGLTADVVWLEEAYRRLPGLACPWTYREPRDTRTLFDLMIVGSWDVNLFREAGEVEHNALHDARAQARAVAWARRQLTEMQSGYQPDIVAAAGLDAVVGALGAADTASVD